MANCGVRADFADDNTGERKFGIMRTNLIFDNGGRRIVPVAGPKGQNLGNSVSTMNGRPRSRGIPKGPQHVRNSVSYALVKTSPKKSKGTIRRLRYVGKSHVACLLIMFLQWRLAMPSLERENVRHATLLFRAEGVTVRTTGAGEG